MDLLSDEGTNRTLLVWLKLWDKLVFNRERKQPRSSTTAVAKPDAGGAPGQPGGNKWRPGNLPEVMEKLDEAGRPLQRVALLHGPPGLGKTTLAHIVAKHAGYKVGRQLFSLSHTISFYHRFLFDFQIIVPDPDP
jgi:chromosome transmission fidelity protein 18